MSEKRASEWAYTYIDNVERIETEINRHDVGDQDPDTTKAICELLLDYKAENAKLKEKLSVAVKALELIEINACRLENFQSEDPWETAKTALAQIKNEN